MIDLEERIAATLQDRAPVFVRQDAQRHRGTGAYPPIDRVLRDARARCGIRGRGGGPLVVGAEVGPTRVQADRSSAFRHPASPQGVEGGVNDATAAPASDPSATEDTSAHGTNSTVPYTEQVEGQEVYLLTQKHVVSFGHVSGIEWSLAAYDTKPYSGDQFSRFLGGSCGDLMVGDQGEYGGIGFCLHTGETAPDGAFAMAGFGNASDRSVGPIVGYAGLVGSQVSSVELRLSGGETRQLPLYDAPSGIGARYFEVFVAEGTGGQIVALGSNGAELGSGSLCISQPPSGPDNVGCGHGLEGVSSVVTSLAEPPTSTP